MCVELPFIYMLYKLLWFVLKKKLDIFNLLHQRFKPKDHIILLFFLLKQKALQPSPTKLHKYPDMSSTITPILHSTLLPFQSLQFDQEVTNMILHDISEKHQYLFIHLKAKYAVPNIFVKAVHGNSPNKIREVMKDNNFEQKMNDNEQLK